MKRIVLLLTALLVLGPFSNDAPGANSLTNAQLLKIFQLSDSQGNDVDLSPGVAAFFGIKAAKMRHLTVEDNPVLRHAFIRFRSDDDSFIIVKIDAAAAWFYFVQKDLTLRNACSLRRGYAPESVEKGKAEEAFREELRVWAEVANDFGKAK